MTDSLVIKQNQKKSQTSFGLFVFQIISKLDQRLLPSQLVLRSIGSLIYQVIGIAWIGYQNKPANVFISNFNILTKHLFYFYYNGYFNPLSVLFNYTQYGLRKAYNYRLVTVRVQCPNTPPKLVRRAEGYVRFATETALQIRKSGGVAKHELEGEFGFQKGCVLWATNLSVT